MNPLSNAESRARGTSEYWNSFLGADIGLVDPDVDTIIGFEGERQARKLIMIPSESMGRWRCGDLTPEN